MHLFFGQIGGVFQAGADHDGSPVFPVIVDDAAKPFVGDQVGQRGFEFLMPLFFNLRGDSAAGVINPMRSFTE